MAGHLDLRALLAATEPELQTGRYVFTTTHRVPEECNPIVVVREHEGVTLVVEQQEADCLGLDDDFVTAPRQPRLTDDRSGQSGIVAR